MTAYVLKMLGVGFGLIAAIAGVSEAKAPTPAQIVAPPVYNSTQSLTAPNKVIVAAPMTTANPTTSTTQDFGTCADYVALARQVGWQPEELPQLLVILRAESSCQPDALGDRTKGGSYGLMQLHCPSWGQPNKYNAVGWLQARNVIDDCTDLFDPATNLYAALLVWQHGGWSQWATYKP